MNKMMRYLLNSSTVDHHLYSCLNGLAKASDKSKAHLLYNNNMTVAIFTNQGKDYDCDQSFKGLSNFKEIN